MQDETAFATELLQFNADHVGEGWTVSGWKM